MTKDHKPLVFIRWDEAAKVYVATSDDISGLVTEAPSVAELQERVLAIAAELMAANGVDAHGIPIHADDVKWVHAKGHWVK